MRNKYANYTLSPCYIVIGYIGLQLLWCIITIVHIICAMKLRLVQLRWFVFMNFCNSCISKLKRIFYHIFPVFLKEKLLGLFFFGEYLTTFAHAVFYFGVVSHQFSTVWVQFFTNVLSINAKPFCGWSLMMLLHKTEKEKRKDIPQVQV